jgi:hypothetical protein
MMIVLQVVIFQRPNHLNLQFPCQVVAEEERFGMGSL